ncbi:MAG: hypothetical protein V5A34_01400 [Halapricum sp.]
MTDEIDNTEWGIDRRTVLKGMGAVSAAGFVGVPAFSGSAAAQTTTETSEITLSWSRSHETGDDVKYSDTLGGAVDAARGLATSNQDVWNGDKYYQADEGQYLDDIDFDYATWEHWNPNGEGAASDALCADPEDYPTEQDGNEIYQTRKFETAFDLPDGVSPEDVTNITLSSPADGPDGQDIIPINDNFYVNLNGGEVRRGGTACPAGNIGEYCPAYRNEDYDTNPQLVVSDGWYFDGTLSFDQSDLEEKDNTLELIVEEVCKWGGTTRLDLTIEYVPTCTVDLLAGQDIDVGSVSITGPEDDDLTVTYETNGDWYLSETHLEVVNDPAEFPTAGNNNPKVGQFEYGQTYGPGMQTDSFTVDVSDLEAPYHVAAHAVVYHVDCGTAGDPSFWASSVADYDLGTQKDGDPIPDDRDDPVNALGAPDGDFVSLGFDNPGTDPDDPGYVVFEFDDPVYNSGDDADVFLQEVTFGRDSYPEELADVYVSPVGEDTFIHAGQISNKDSYDGNAGLGAVGIPDGIVAVDAVKVVDATDPDNFEGDDDADGYDLDAVGADCLVDQEETAWGDGCPFTERGNWATYTVFNPDGDKCGCPEE